jgi:phytoene synthase
MEQGWATLLSPDPLGAEELSDYADARGRQLFSLSARLLGGAGEVAFAGEAWSLVDLARHSSEPSDVEAALAAARERLRPGRWPALLRPLGMLAVLAARDLETDRPRWEPQGSPGRMLRMLRHRLTGG